jgi:hypothetical protein
LKTVLEETDVMAITTTIIDVLELFAPLRFIKMILVALMNALLLLIVVAVTVLLVT